MDIDLLNRWLLDATSTELQEFLQEQPYNEKNTDLFFNWLLRQFEYSEQYERCALVRDEIAFRIKLRTDMESGIYDDYFDSDDDYFDSNE